jgi:methyl-accepting chemotaxis protein
MPRSRRAGIDLPDNKPTQPADLQNMIETLHKLAQLAGKTEEMGRQNVALATETRELIKVVRDEMTGVKQDIKGIKGDVQELKEQFRKTAPIQSR